MAQVSGELQHLHSRQIDWVIYLLKVKLYLLDSHTNIFVCGDYKVTQDNIQRPAHVKWISLVNGIGL